MQPQNRQFAVHSDSSGCPTWSSAGLSRFMEIELEKYLKNIHLALYTEGLDAPVSMLKTVLFWFTGGNDCISLHMTGRIIKQVNPPFTYLAEPSNPAYYLAPSATSTCAKWGACWFHWREIIWDINQKSLRDSVWISNICINGSQFEANANNK